MTNLILSLAYTYYSFFEWSLIFLDILYDSVTKLEFKDADLQVTSKQCILILLILMIYVF